MHGFDRRRPGVIQERAPDFDAPASESQIQKVMVAVRANNIDARVVDTADQARRLVLELIPQGAEVYSGNSKTLQDIGVAKELFESGRYDSVRERYTRMDRQTQGREIRKLMAAPDYMLVIIRREWVDDRITVIFVREPVGV